mgnify:CR=1 FL=1
MEKTYLSILEKGEKPLANTIMRLTQHFLACALGLWALIVRRNCVTLASKE